MAGRRALPKPPSQKQLDKAFKPYAIEIGFLTRSWNLLHDNLGKIFGRIMEHPIPHVPIAVWYSATSDRTQREMLRAACAATFRVSPGKRPGLKDDIKWLLSKVQTLADQRNDAIHAPLVLITGDAFTGIEVMAAYFDGNPRAIKLKDKDILAELKWYRESAETLRGYAFRLLFSLGHPDRSLPRRPAMPPLLRRPSQKRLRRRSPAK